MLLSLISRSTIIFHLAGLSPSTKTVAQSDIDQHHHHPQKETSSPIPKSIETINTHRIIWCLYVPDHEDQIDASRYFVLCRKSRAHIFNLDMILSTYKCGINVVNELDEFKRGGHLIIDGVHKASILTACFSPDGTAIATACAAGDVCIFKIAFENGENGQFMRSNSTSENLNLNDGKQVDQQKKTTTCQKLFKLL